VVGARRSVFSGHPPAEYSPEANYAPRVSYGGPIAGPVSSFNYPKRRGEIGKHGLWALSCPRGCRPPRWV